MKFSDIQLADKALWAQIQQAWKNGDYSAIASLVSNDQLDGKALSANALNALTEKIVEVENLSDPSYAADRIQVLRQPPQQINVGEVYFDATNWPYTWAEVDAQEYTFGDIDNLGLTWAQADKGGW